jgi:hypothetical protein
LSIINLTGKGMMTKEVASAVVQLDVRDLPEGVYFVRMTGEKSGHVGDFGITR